MPWHFFCNAILHFLNLGNTERVQIWCSTIPAAVFIVEPFVSYKVFIIVKTTRMHGDALASSWHVQTDFRAHFKIPSCCAQLGLASAAADVGNWMVSTFPYEFLHGKDGAAGEEVGHVENALKYFFPQPKLCTKLCMSLVRYVCLCVCVCVYVCSHVFHSHEHVNVCMRTTHTSDI